MENLMISRHAYTRIKERNGWNRKAAIRMIPRVYSEGLRPSQVKGYLRQWVGEKVANARPGHEFILYGERLYIFNGGTVITVLTAPTRAQVLGYAPYGRDVRCS